MNDGCNECLKVLKSCAFSRRLVTLNLYGLLLSESALMHMPISCLENLVTLRMSVHEELEEMGPIYEMQNLVYLKTKALER